jgi:hypothetical protein
MSFEGLSISTLCNIVRIFRWRRLFIIRQPKAAVKYSSLEIKLILRSRNELLLLEFATETKE